MSDLKRLCLTSVAICAISAPALAQGENFYSRDKYEAVLDRPQPAYDPEPVRLGAFVVSARGDVGVSYTDNVFVTSSNRESAVIARIGGQVSGTTDWNVHAVGFDVSAHRNEYVDQGDESHNDLRGQLRGRLDVSREFSLGGTVFAERSAEPRFDNVNEFGIDAPLEYTRYGAAIDADYASDRVRWLNRVGIVEEDFDNSRQIGTGLPVDQSFRDRTVTEARSRLSYAVSPNLAVFAQGTYVINDYSTTQLLGGEQRSRGSKTSTIAAGVDFELNALVRGDIAVGYLQDKKDDSFFQDVSGLSVDGRMQWFPTRLTTVTFTAGRGVIDIGAFEDPSVVQTRAGARVDHELRRNIIGSLFANFTHQDYEQTGRNDESTELGAIALYKMNKRAHFEAFVTHQNRDASGLFGIADPNYRINTVGVALRLYP